MITAIHHIQLAAPPNSEQTARAFYGDLLGLPEIAKPDELKKRGGVWFQLGEQQLHVGIEQDFIPARKAHPALVVAGPSTALGTSLDALHHKLEAAGYATQSDALFPGYRRFYAHDPFGNRLEFVEPLVV